MQEWEKKKIRNTLMEWTHELNYCEGILKSDDLTNEDEKYARSRIAEAKKNISQIKAEIASWKE